MAQNVSTTDSGARFRRILARIDEQEGSPPAPQPVPVTPAPAPATPAYTAPIAPEEEESPGLLRRVFSWEGFKTFAILFSFTVNAILVLVLVVAGYFLFDVKQEVAKPLVGGLYNNFVAMDQAHIRTTILVDTTIPVNDKVTATFDLPLRQDTIVILSQDTVIAGASVTIQGGVLQLTDAPATIVLPAGTQLPITLDLGVPVNEDIPVVLDIPVSIPVAIDIPLEQTELHRPFANLRDLFGPYNDLLRTTPDSWMELTTLGNVE